MRALAPLIALLLASTALAGCFGGGAPAEPVGPTTQPPATPPGGAVNNTTLPEVSLDNATVEVQVFEGAVAGVGDPGVAQVRVSGENGAEFEVAEGTTGIVVEAVWAAADALDLYVNVPAAHCAPVDPVGLLAECPDPEPATSGRSPARIMVTDPAQLNLTGTWSAAMFARTSAAEVPFTLYISLFRGEVPTDAYTAVLPEGGR